MSEWQDMESAPKDGTPVLLFAGLKRDGRVYMPIRVVGWFSLDIKGWIAMGYGHQPIAELEPYNWMPLPNLPN